MVIIAAALNQSLVPQEMPVFQAQSDLAFLKPAPLASI